MPSQCAVPDQVPLIADDGLIVSAVAAIQHDAVDWEENLPVWSCYSNWCFVCYHTKKKIFIKDASFFFIHTDRWSGFVLPGSTVTETVSESCWPLELVTVSSNIYWPSRRSESCRNGDLTSWKQVAYENINSTSTAQHFRLSKFTYI